MPLVLASSLTEETLVMLFRLGVTYHQPVELLESLKS